MSGGSVDQLQVVIERLDKQKHRRDSFSCGREPLDRYLKQQASQDVARRGSSCWVARDTRDGVIAGYYTLSVASFPSTSIPPEGARKLKLPPYQDLGALKLGRLAVDERYQRSGLGTALVHDACERAANLDPPVIALIVDAKDEEAAQWYERRDFVRRSAGALQLVLPIAWWQQANR